LIELDLFGRKLRLADSDVRWLRARAERAAGSSSPSRDIATLLGSAKANGAVALHRTEARALLRLLDGAEPPSPALEALHSALSARFKR
jgi:hypothetical protein